MHKKHLILGALAAILFASCASDSASNGDKSSKSDTLSKKDGTAKYLSALDEGNYEKAEKTFSKIKKDKKNAIRDNYDQAMLYHFQGEYDESLKLLGQTDRMMEDAVTKSISRGVAAALINENSTEYEGNPYEYIYINVFNALNYYNLGNEEEAAVEIRRMNDKKKSYLVKYGELLLSDDNYNSDADVQNAYSTLHINPKDVDGKEPAKPKAEDIFKDSPLARYMSLLFYMMEGDVSNAQLDARLLAAMNQTFDTKSELEISRGMGRLDVISFTDKIGRREEERIVIGPFPGFVFTVNKILVDIPSFDIEFVYPKFNHTDKSPVTAVKMIVDDKEKVLPLLEDFNYAVQMDVNSKANKAYGRSVRRSLAKKLSAVAGGAGSVVAAQIAAQKAEDPIAIAVSQAAAIAAVIALAPAIEAVDKTETADIRQVYALPGKAYASGLELAPGTYDVTVQYLSGNRVISEKKYEGVRVRANKPTIVESLY